MGRSARLKTTFVLNPVIKGKQWDLTLPDLMLHSCYLLFKCQADEECVGGCGSVRFVSASRGINEEVAKIGRQGKATTHDQRPIDSKPI